MSKIIEIKDMIWEQQEQCILNIPYFSLESEESVSLMGPNGAGKSSFLSIMAGLQKPTSGSIYLFGKNIKEIPSLELRRRVSFVFQKPMMMDLTVMENLELGLKFRGVKDKEREMRIEPWLERLGITHLVKKRARLLSGGEAQRVCIAQALVVKPEILFLDEPFANLDKKARLELIDEVGTLLKNEKITIAMVTHYRSEAAAISASIYHMEDGEILDREFLSPEQET